MSFNFSKWFFLGLMLVFFQAKAQDEEKLRSWNLNGYVKDMVTYTIPNSPLLPNDLLDNLVHNRLNFKWYVSNDLKFVAEMRNRIFIGDQVRMNPTLASQIDNAQDYFDLAYTWEDSGNVIANFMLDRLYLRYVTGNFESTLGRQRINWGINMAWNPNDIFNAFSFFDFDYEERPGSDALLLKYYTGIASSIEIAGKMADNWEEFTGAALWKTNFLKYDAQVLAGITSRNVVVGGGWAGNIAKAGFKGESSYFIPLSTANDKTYAFNAAVSLDYSFKSSLYLTGSILYSSNSSVSPTSIEQLLYYNGVISAKYLSPYRWSGLINASYQFHPLFTGGLSLIGYPGNNDMFLGPQASFSILQSLDLDLFAQIVFGDKGTTYTALAQSYFLRLKYSF